ncbi:hypothetical protein TKK_0013340 [Trichogramma kaykai]
MRPTRPKYNRTWDVSLVLNLISTWYPLNNLNLEKLSKKISILLALVTAHRVQTLTAINVKNIVRREGKIEIEITDHIKTSASGKTQPLLVLPYFKDKPELCAASTLDFYLEKTKEIRHDEQQLLISFKNPHKAISAQTFSKWIKCVLNDSAGWSEKSEAFARFYNRPIINDSSDFAMAIVD